MYILYFGFLLHHYLRHELCSFRYVLCSLGFTTYVMICDPSRLLPMPCKHLYYVHVGMSLITHPEGLGRGITYWVFFYTHSYLFYVFEENERAYWCVMRGPMIVPYGTRRLLSYSFCFQFILNVLIENLMLRLFYFIVIFHNFSRVPFYLFIL